MKEINKMFIAMFMIVITILIIPASVYSVEDMTINPTFPTSTTSDLPEDERDLGESIIVNVEQYEPTVVKSQLIEDSNVPVVVYLTGSTLGSLLMQENSPSSEPFIGNPIIKTATVYPVGSGSTEYLASAQYIAPEMSARSVENLGYVYLLLRQIKDETKVPDKIDLNMSMKIYFDFTRGFGDVSTQDLVLKESSDEIQWKASGDADKNAFWNRKGYLRATLIEGNRAKIQVYGSGFGILSIGNANELERRGVVTMSPGETRVLTLPGTSAFFHDRFSLTLTKISEPENTAEIVTVVNGERTTRTLAKDMKIYPGSDWTIYLITGTGSCTADKDCSSGKCDATIGRCINQQTNCNQLTNQGKNICVANTYCSWQDTANMCIDRNSQQIVVIRNSMGDTRTLLITTNTQVNDVGEITDPSQYENDICKDKITFSNEGDLTNEQKKIEAVLNSESNSKNEQTIKLYCSAIDQYKKAIEYAGSNTKYNYNPYLMIGDTYLSIAEVSPWVQQTKIKRLAEYYYGKAEPTSETAKKIEDIRKGINENSVSLPASIPEEGAYVILSKINAVTAADKSTAQLNIGNEIIDVVEGNKIEQLGVDYGVQGKKSEWIVTRIENGRVYLERRSNFGFGTQNTAVVSQTYSTDMYEIISSDKISRIYTKYNGEVADTNSAKEISLVNIISKKRAYVTVSPGTGESYSTSSFQVHIGIDKRAIQWTPEQIDKMINQTQKQIDQLSKVIKQLDDILKVWKNVCLVTFGLLVAKNAFGAGAAERAMARKEIMPYYDDICKQEILKSTEQTTLSKCLSDKSGEIEQSLNVVQKYETTKKECLKSKDNSYAKSNLKEEGIWDSTLDNAETLYKNALISAPVDKSTLCDYDLYCNGLNKEPDLEGIKKQTEKKCTDLTTTIDNKKQAWQAAYDETIKTFPEMSKFSEMSLEQQKQATNKFSYLNSLASGYLDSKTKISKEEEAEIKSEFQSQYSGTKYGSVTYLPLALETTITNPDGTTKTEVSSYKLPSSTDSGNLKFEGIEKYIPLAIKDIPGENPTKSNCNAKPNSVDKEACLNSAWTFQGYRVYQKVESVGDSSQGKTYVIAGSTTSFAETGLNTAYAKNAKAEFDKDGKPYCIPTGENGNYVKILSWYDSGSPQDCEYWNVGADGMLCSGDDNMVVDKTRINLDKRSMGKCETLARKYSKCKEGDSLIGSFNPQTSREFMCSQQGYKLAQQMSNANCQDFMDPDDCKTLFAVCDPVMCPNSRFNLGGNYNVAGSVVETGIIGSLILGMPNYPETPLPVCLPGISAGLKNIRSLLEGFVSCLHTAKINHENIGICDKIRSIGVCELLWKEAINVMNMYKGGIITFANKLFGIDSGGSEYLSFDTNMETTSNMVNYFTKEYASNAFSAYNAMSTQEFGAKICKAAIFGKFTDIGNIMDQISEPENPPQFYAQFDESPTITRAGNLPSIGTNVLGNIKELSSYSVYYHIYAGTIPETARVGTAASGVKYAVFLTDEQGYSIPVTSTQRGTIYSTIPYGSYADQNIDITDKSGMTKICIYINGRTECGFGKVTTNFALNYINDQLVESESMRKISKKEQCIPDSPTLSTSLGSVVLPEEYGAISTGIIRTCSTINPGSGTNPNDWKVVGTCGKDKTGNDLGSCWIDTRTIDIKNVQAKENVMSNLQFNQTQLMLGNKKFAEIVGKLFDTDISKNYFSTLELKLEQAKKNNLGGKETKQKDFMNLLLGSETIGQTKEGTDTAGTGVSNVAVNYRMLSLYSLDLSTKVFSQIRAGEIYKLLGDSIIQEVNQCDYCGEGETCNQAKKTCETETVTKTPEDSSSVEVSKSKTQTVLSNQQTITIKKGETQTAILKDFPEFFITLKASNAVGIRITIPSDCGDVLGGSGVLTKGDTYTLECTSFNKKVSIKVIESDDNLAKLQINYIGEGEKSCKNGCGYSIFGLTSTYGCDEDKCRSLFGEGVCYYGKVAGEIVTHSCINCPSECTTLKEEDYCVQCDSCVWYKDQCWKNEGWLWAFKQKSEDKSISVNGFSKVCLIPSMNTLFSNKEKGLNELLEKSKIYNGNDLDEKRLSITIPLSIKQYKSLSLKCKDGTLFLVMETVPKEVPQ